MAADASQKDVIIIRTVTLFKPQNSKDALISSRNAHLKEKCEIFFKIWFILLSKIRQNQLMI